MKKTNSLIVPVFSFLVCIFFLACKKDTTAPDPSHKPPVVNAGTAQSVSLPLDSITVTGRVTDSASKIVSYLWSEVSGPNVPVIKSEGSLSTKITGLIVGTYVFQLMAVDTFGLTGVDTLQVLVNPAPLQTVSLTPANNPYEYQYIGNTGIDYSSGEASKELGAEAWTMSGNTVFVRSAFRFDLSSIPVQSVKSAKLTLFSNPTPFTANLSTPNFGTANAMYIQRVSASWNPATTTWATQPATDTAGEVLIPQTNTSTLDLVGVDVTSMVNAMISTNNYGFMIRLQNETTYNSRIFCSSKYTDATKYPQLVITY